MAPRSPPHRRWLLLLRLFAAGPLPCRSATRQETIRASAVVSATTDKQIHLEKIATVDLPRPAAADDAALVRVVASSINPCNWKFPFLAPSPSWTYPKVLLSDFAGQLVEVGSGAACQGLQVGEHVWGMADGAAAEVIAVPCSTVGLAPSAFGLQEAAVLPLVALTGLQGFRWAGGFEFVAGKAVLVLGGSGGTGHTGIQLAKAFGAKHVVTTCSAENADFVRSIGADEVIDYHSTTWYRAILKGSLDLVYDTVCQDGTGDLAYPLLRDGGRFMTLLPGSLASPSTAAARPAVRQTFYMLNQTAAKDLDVLRGLAEAGKLRGKVSGTYSLDEVRGAFAASIAGHVAGKLAISVAQPPSPEAYYM